MIKSLNDEKYRAFLNELKSARLTQGLTVRDVGARIKEPNQFISKIESGARRLTVHEFVQYCRALDIEPCDLLKYLE